MILFFLGVFIGIFIGFWVAAFGLATHMSKMTKRADEEMEFIRKF